MRNERKRQIMTLSILVVAVLVLSVGFAAFSTTLRINTSAMVNPNSGTFSVKFSKTKDTLTEADIVPTNKTTGITVTNGIIDNSANPTLTNLSAEFKNPGDYVEYVFYARNEGEYVAYLNNINFIGEKTCTAGEGATQEFVESACNSISATVSVGGVEYTSTTPVTNHTLNKSTGEEIKVVLKYDDNGTRVDGPFTVSFGEITMVYSTIDDSTFTPEEQIICTNITGDRNTPGSKYECEVKAGTKYNFYVLSTEANGSTNLIMDRNMCSDGTPTDPSKSDKCFTPWNISESNTDGPVTAIEYLYNATKTWTNIPALNYAYYDKTYIGQTTTARAYNSFISVDGVATITPLTGEATIIGTADAPLRARMPIYSASISDNVKSKEKGEVSDKKADNSNAYLYENLGAKGGNYPYGYWTLSSFYKSTTSAWRVFHDGTTLNYSVHTDDALGVRPVINLKYYLFDK